MGCPSTEPQVPSSKPRSSTSSFTERVWTSVGLDPTEYPGLSPRSFRSRSPVSGGRGPTWCDPGPIITSPATHTTHTVFEVRLQSRPLCGRLGVSPLWDVHTPDTVPETPIETGLVCGRLSITPLRDISGRWSGPRGFLRSQGLGTTTRGVIDTTYTVLEGRLKTGPLCGRLCVTTLRDVHTVYTVPETAVKAGVVRGRLCGPPRRGGWSPRGCRR